MQSKYYPPRPSWQQDLHKGIYSLKKNLTSNKKLRYCNDNYCELSRRPSIMQSLIKWIFILISFLTILLTLFTTGMVIFLSSYGYTSKEIVIFIPSSFLVFYVGYVFLHLFLCLITAPEDCPIRLNRKTGKVYIYEHNIMLPVGSWAMLKTSLFKVKNITIKEFDWNAIQAVLTSVSMPLSSGGTVRNYRIECVICLPDKNKIIDHFILSTGTDLCYDEWMWINSYMNFSDKNLDKTTFEKNSWLAKKIVWPAEIDKKSQASSLVEVLPN